MGLGIVIAAGQALALSTTESADQVIATYQYPGPGRFRLFAKGSDANVRVNFFLNGQQICRRMNCFTGTAGTLDTSANPLSDVTSVLGGRAELNFVATTGTPTVDFFLFHEAMSIPGAAISKLLRR